MPGPLLFLLYINHLPLVIEDFMTQFGDDEELGPLSLSNLVRVEAGLCAYFAYVHSRLRYGI